MKNKKKGIVVKTNIKPGKTLLTAGYSTSPEITISNPVEIIRQENILLKNSFFKYNVPNGDWQKLSIALLREYDPEWQWVRKKKSGRPTWNMMQTFLLWFEVQVLIKDKKMSRNSAFIYLAKQPHWNPELDSQENLKELQKKNLIKQARQKLEKAYQRYVKKSGLVKMCEKVIAEVSNGWEVIKNSFNPEINSSEKKKAYLARHDQDAKKLRELNLPY